ncbi:effector binding domain-containing protein [Clostridium minihomine]|uniref:effector binding domain-containing protein n=1 Tax=Clostridium minihomine TaxID=2045012 RepID=UPI000C79318E|nr:effector binding domain-containing protein [Clostridium minihomine]
MPYQLKEATIRTDNTAEGIKRIEEMWQDVSSGKLPILFNNELNFLPGISPVSRYSNYESDENGNYDFSILGVTSDFFKELDSLVSKDLYQKYDESDETGNLQACTQKAWQKVWNQQQSGEISRAFTEDFESTVPAEYTKDGKAHCYLYIAVKGKSEPSV